MVENFQNELQKQFFEHVSNNNRMEVLKYFREIEYKPWEYVDEEGNTALHKSTFLDYTILTITMIDEIKLRFGDQSFELLVNWLNQTTKEGFSPIHYACFRGNVELIIKLIENKADYNAVNRQGLNCLHVAAQGNKPQSLVYMIEKFKMNINLNDKVGSTALHWACYTGSENALNFILAMDSQINAQDKDGYTPLHLAVISERTRIIKKLLLFGANKEIKSIHNVTPLQLAIDKEKYNIVELLNDKTYLSKFYLFKSPLIKAERSNGNVYLFFFLHILVEVSVFFILLPFFKSQYIVIFYLIFFVQMLFVYIYLLASNPGIMKKSDNECFIKIIENNENILIFCPYCKIKKTKDSLHCFICDKCIDGFDHHCFWVNNCIGKKNHIMFIVFLLFLIMNLFLNIFIGIHASVILDENIFSNFPPKLPFSLIYKRGVRLSISIGTIIVSLAFIIPVLILLGNQIKTHCFISDSMIILKNQKDLKKQNTDSEEEKNLLNTQ